MEKAEHRLRELDTEMVFRDFTAHSIVNYKMQVF